MLDGGMFWPLPYCAVDRPVGLQQVVRVDRRQPRVVLDRVLDERRAVQIADGLAVVGKLREVLLVVRELDARRDRAVSATLQLVFGVRLQRGRAEHLVEVRQRRVHPRARIGRRLVAIRRRVFRPQPGAEHADATTCTDRQVVADLPVAVQLVGRARRRDRRRAVEVLLVVVPHRVDLVVDRPAVAKVGAQPDVLEVAWGRGRS